MHLYTNSALTTPVKQGDRFIPCRSTLDADTCNSRLFSTTDQMHTPYQEAVATALSINGVHKRVIPFSPAAPIRQSVHSRLRSTHFPESPPIRSVSPRTIPKTPFKILDAPQFRNNYYLSLLAWSARNVLAIALDKTVYVYMVDSGDVHEILTTTPIGTYIASLAFSRDGKTLTIGINTGSVHLWDVDCGMRAETLHDQVHRINAIDWRDNFVYSTGSFDHRIVHRDVRAPNPIGLLAGHDGEICGLKWSPSGDKLATGADDDHLMIWDGLNSSVPLFTFDRHHTAAVKAIAWCPWKSDLLASGGGTKDCTIRMWNAASGNCLGTTTTTGQVAAVQWSPDDRAREIIAAHGPDGALEVWRYPSMASIAKLHHHKNRVLQMVQSPNGRTVATVGADERLCFWNVFDYDLPKPAAASPVGRLSRAALR